MQISSCGAVMLSLMVAMASPASPVSTPAPPASRPAAVEGTVVGPDGKPVAGALVAAVAYGAAPEFTSVRAAALARSGEDGGFRLEGLSDATYGITATAPDLTGSYVGDVKVEGGKTAAPVALRLGGEGVTLEGLARGADGNPVAGAEVRAFRFSDVEGDLFFAVAGSDGRYRVVLPAARYMVVVAEGDRVLSQAPFGEPPGLRRPPPAEVLAWIRANAIPLATPEAGHGLADMAPLAKVVGGARVVALGEATHGTREFFQLKHRMLEFLASELGFTVFGIEATMPEGFDVNDYVLTGKGDPAKALAGLYFWTWNTEEVLEMIRWMRRWNENPARPRKLKFYGFDMQSAPRAVRVAVDYVRKVDPASADRSAQALAVLANPLTATFADRLPADAKQALAKAAADLVRRFDESQADWSKRTGKEAWSVARQHARIVEQNVELITAKEGDFSIRDRSMAENVRWILEHEGPGAKMVLWAHNGHVADDKLGGSSSMGAHLRKALGPDLVIFGFAFNQGSFQAVEMPFQSGKGRHDFTVPPAPPGSLDGALALAGVPLAALDLRTVPKEGPVAAWLSAEHTTRSIGAGFSDALADNFWASQRVAALYDALLFVDRTTAARANPGSTRTHVEPLPAPRNLDFEEGKAGEAPPGWRMEDSDAVFGFETATTDRRCSSGERCAVVRRAGGRHYGETAGTLHQVVDASPYRGRRVRLRASARIEAEPGAGQAYLHLMAPSSKERMTFTGLNELQPVASVEWREYEVAGEVPEDAVRLDFGFSLVGNGKAYVDAVKIEVLPQEPHAGAAASSRRTSS